MENNKQQMPESVWADGIPAKIEDADKITPDELADMAITHIMKNLVIARGFKIEPGFPRKQVPNIICKRNGRVIGIMVVPSVFPNYATINDDFRIKLVTMCKEQNVEPYFAPVGYKSIDEERAKAQLALKGDVFYTSFPGLIKLTDDEKQNFAFEPKNLYNPDDDSNMPMDYIEK